METCAADAAADAAAQLPMSVAIFLFAISFFHYHAFFVILVTHALTKPCSMSRMQIRRVESTCVSSEIHLHSVWSKA